jgi:hypothetical protein
LAKASPKSSGSSPKFQINSFAKEYADLTQPELYQKLDELDAIRSELIDEIERTKGKARLLLAKKELQERRLKQIIFKLETYLKQRHCECGCDITLSQDRINQIGAMTEQEVQQSLEMERLAELESDNNDPGQTAEVITVAEKQIHDA